MIQQTIWFGGLSKLRNLAILLIKWWLIMSFLDTPFSKTNSCGMKKGAKVLLYDVIHDWHGYAPSIKRHHVYHVLFSGAGRREPFPFRFFSQRWRYGWYRVIRSSNQPLVQKDLMILYPKIWCFFSNMDHLMILGPPQPGISGAICQDLRTEDGCWEGEDDAANVGRFLLQCQEEGRQFRCADWAGKEAFAEWLG